MAEKKDFSNSLMKDRLTVWDALAQSMAFIGPVMAMAFLTPMVAGGAGGAVPLALLLAALATLSIGVIVSRFARRFAAAGSIYEYVNHAFGAGPGFLAGWLYFLATYLLTIALFPAVGGWVSDLLASHGIKIHWLVVDVIVIGIIFLLSYYDAKISTRTQLVLVFTSMLVVVVFALYIIFIGGAEGNTIKPFLPSTSLKSWPGIFFGLIYGFMIFMGFESSAVLGEETRNPKKSIPIVILGSVAMVSVYYLIVSYATAIGLGPANFANWGADPTPLFTLAAKFGNPLLVDVISVAAIVDAIAVILGCHVTATRVLFAMGRDGMVPTIFGHTHPKHKTPVVAIIFVLVTAAIFHFAFQQMGPFGEFALGSGTGSLGVVVIYLVVGASGIAFFKGKEGGFLLRWLASVIAMVISGFAIYASVYPTPPAPLNLMPYILLAWILLGCLVFVAHKVTNSRFLQARAAKDVLDVEA